MTKTEWTKKIRQLAPMLHRHPRYVDDGKFVDAVVYGMQRGFITTERAMAILTDPARVPRDWRP